MDTLRCYIHCESNRVGPLILNHLKNDPYIKFYMKYYPTESSSKTKGEVYGVNQVERCDTSALVGMTSDIHDFVVRMLGQTSHITRRSYVKLANTFPEGSPQSYPFCDGNCLVMVLRKLLNPIFSVGGKKCWHLCRQRSIKGGNIFAVILQLKCCYPISSPFLSSS